MGTSIRLGRISGISIELSWTWFLIFGLVTWSLAIGYFPAEYPTLSPAVHLLIALVTSVLFFSSVMLHELGHAYAALREGVGVRSITLFIFGGVARLEDEPPTAGAALRVALAGPVVSVFLAIVFGGLWLLDQNVPWLAAPSAYLARLNFLLAAFNMIPGYPLDGGRVLQAVVWYFSGDGRRATRIAAMVGQLVAFGFIGAGIVLALNDNLFNGLWLAFIGWFLQNAAGAAATGSDLEAAGHRHPGDDPVGGDAGDGPGQCGPGAGRRIWPPVRCPLAGRRDARAAVDGNGCGNLMDFCRHRSDDAVFDLPGVVEEVPDDAAGEVAGGPALAAAGTAGG